MRRPCERSFVPRQVKKGLNDVGSGLVSVEGRGGGTVKTLGKPPVVLLSFNRPDYLRETAESLSLNNLEGRGVFVFQDGAVNAFSSQAYSSEDSIMECVAIIRNILPSSSVYISDHNIGIAENFRRAERFIFVEQGYDAAYFFEDDMVLSPLYLDVMDKLYTQTSPHPVGLFSAYGQHRATLDMQTRNLEKVLPLHHNWGYGLRRAHWHQMQAFMDGYHKILEGVDYRQRDHQRIREYFAQHGVMHPSTSQDAAKWLANLLCDRTAVTTYPCFGRYIGAEGVHWRRAAYLAEGYEHAILSQECPAYFELSSDIVYALLARDRSISASLYAQFSNGSK